jgi:hypothetical protein
MSTTALELDYLDRNRAFPNASEVLGGDTVASTGEHLREEAENLHSDLYAFFFAISVHYTLPIYPRFKALFL